MTEPATIQNDFAASMLAREQPLTVSVVGFSEKCLEAVKTILNTVRDIRIELLKCANGAPFDPDIIERNEPVYAFVETMNEKQGHNPVLSVRLSAPTSVSDEPNMEGKPLTVLYNESTRFGTDWVIVENACSSDLPLPASERVLSLSHSTPEQVAARISGGPV